MTLIFNHEELKEFAKIKKKKIDFPKIDLEFYYEFVRFLQDLKLAQNTVGKKSQRSVFMRESIQESCRAAAARRNPPKMWMRIRSICSGISAKTLALV